MELYVCKHVIYSYLIQLETAFSIANRQIIQMGAVQIVKVFSLVFRNRSASVCVKTRQNYNLSLIVHNANYPVGHLLIMVRVVDTATSACTNPWILNFLIHTLEDSVKMVPVRHRCTA